MLGDRMGSGREIRVKEIGCSLMAAGNAAAGVLGTRTQGCRF